MRIEILDEAERDLLDGAFFYETQDVGLGQYFLDSLFSDIDSLQLYAGVHSVHFGFHRLLSQRFPFAIYYRVDGAIARVWAVLDCRRDPERTANRLAGSKE
jgi:plasmid stabilization system protein ParE